MNVSDNAKHQEKKTGAVPNSIILSTILIRFCASLLIKFSSLPYPKLKKINPNDNFIKTSVRTDNILENLNIIYYTKDSVCLKYTILLNRLIF